MKTSNDHGGQKAGGISVEAATKAASIQSEIEKIKGSWDAFRSADTVRLSVLRKHHYSSAFDLNKTVESLPMAAVAPILQQHFEDQIHELNEEIIALGFKPTILSLEHHSEEEAPE